MTFLKNVWNWLVLSSNDPSKTSLFVKGILGSASVALLLVLGIFHYSVQPEQISNLIDLIVLAVNATLTAVSYVATAIALWATVWGAVRKLYTSLSGTNAVINSTVQ